MFDFNKYQSMYSTTLIPKIICVDGFKISVQASGYHSCEPKQNNAKKYYLVECGFPSEKCEELAPYIEDPMYPTETVYSYVPVEVVENIVNSHGGIKGNRI